MNRETLIFHILRRRKQQKKMNEEKAFESSSIGDIAFLLLIFFIVTSSFILRQGIFLSLPSKTSSSIKLNESQLVEIFPANEGFILNGRLVERSALKDVLILKKGVVSEPVLVIRMRSEVRYDRLVDILSVAKEVGGYRVSLKNAGG